MNNETKWSATLSLLIYFDLLMSKYNKLSGLLFSNVEIATVISSIC